MAYIIYRLMNCLLRDLLKKSSFPPVCAWNVTETATSTLKSRLYLKKQNCTKMKRIIDLSNRMRCILRLHLQH